MANPVVEDLKDKRVPQPLYWSVEQVCDWIGQIGLKQYQECFEVNRIDGRTLINVTASRLPDIGVTDFEHIKIIAKGVRELLQLEEPFWNRSISFPPRNDIGMYIEKKSARGKYVDSLTYQQYLNTHPDVIWQPPFNNHCQLLPH